MVNPSLQIKLINQAIAAAQASLELSKSLLLDLSGDAVKPAAAPANPALGASSILGILGTYDGENMVAASGEKFAVPANYASKTLLVYGDKLKMIDGEGADGEKRKLFKSIERVKSQEVTGWLSKKGDQWLLVTSDGAHKVLDAAVNYFGFKEGEHLVGVLPAENLKAPFAALKEPEKISEVSSLVVPEPIEAAVEASKPVNKIRTSKLKKNPISDSVV